MAGKKCLLNILYFQHTKIICVTQTNIVCIICYELFSDSNQNIVMVFNTHTDTNLMFCIVCFYNQYRVANKHINSLLISTLFLSDKVDEVLAT